MRVEQRFATSKDGTRVPYFVVWPNGAKADGNNPTLLYGYGGFEVSLQPWYSGAFGSAWYSRGGVLVVANIRGGGEFGPGWHQAAVLQHKQRSYDDFIAVAEDLIAQRITEPRHLGIEGGSNGGLLVGAVMLQRPELFNARGLPGAAARHAALPPAAGRRVVDGRVRRPRRARGVGLDHRVQPVPERAHASTSCRRVLFTTATRDDRVHPGHARKMAARMLRAGPRACCTTRTSKAATAAPPTTRSAPTCWRWSSASCGSS